MCWAQAQARAHGWAVATAWTRFQAHIGEHFKIILNMGSSRPLLGISIFLFLGALFDYNPLILRW